MKIRASKWLEIHFLKKFGRAPVDPPPMSVCVCGGGGGGSAPSHTLPTLTACAARFKPFASIAPPPPPVNNPSGSSPAHMHKSLLLNAHADVSSML